MKQAILSMHLLASFVALVLIIMVEGHPNKISSIAKETVAPNPVVKAMKYWQTIIPNAPMPPAILDLIIPKRDDKKFTSQAVGKGHMEKPPTIEEVNYDWKFPLVYYASKEVGDAEVHTIPQSKDRDDKKLISRAIVKGHKDKPLTTKEVNYDWKFPLVYYASKEVGDAEGHTIPQYKENDDKKLTSRAVGKGHKEKAPTTEEVKYDWKFPLVYYASKEVGDAKGEKLEHVHSSSSSSSDGHGAATNSNAGIFMFEEELIPGAMLTARIASSSPYRPPLLKREIAESLPLSSKNFTDIVAMFAPASLTMLDDIKFTQAVCEDPRRVKGEKKACAPSVESMVDLATSILGTRDVRAMSSDVPVEGVPARRYRLAAVRRATGSQKMVTCHGMRYPYAVFMCHSIYPSRSYYVTLAAGDGSPPTEALVMCHLDTSSWAPNHYFFQFTRTKPGEKAACHFVNRGTIVWAPNGKQGEAQAAE